MPHSNIRPIAAAPRLSDGYSGFELDMDRFELHGTLKFRPHEHLFLQGDTPKGVFQVLSGTVILYKLLSNGRRQIQDFSSVGDFLALTYGEEHDLSAEALTDVEVQFVPQARFDRALQTDPDFRRRCFSVIGKMLHSARDQAVLLGRKSALERVASFLLFLEARFTDPSTGFADIRMSRCDIADYLGLTLETVSRQMNRLKRERVIDLPHANRFRILNRARLLQLAGDVDDAYIVHVA